MLGRITAQLQGDSLRAKSVRSTLWTTFGFGLQNILRLGSNLILTRLLVPEMFGIMALAFVFLQGLSLMSDMGTQHSVVRSKRGEDPAFLRTAWTVQAIRDALITLFACLIAWPVAQLYDEPILFPVLCVLSLNTAFHSVTSISVATASRNMELSRLTLLQLMSQVSALSAMVLLAWHFESIWALVAGSLVGSILMSIGSHLFLKPFKHRFELEREALREIINYGKWAIFSSMFTFLGGQGIPAVQGLLVSVQTLGLLAISTNLIRAVEDLVQKLLTNVGYPALTKTLRENPDQLRPVLRKLRLTLLLSNVALLLALSASAQAVIDFLYDPRYALAGSFLALQALNGALRMISVPYQNVIIAHGDSRTHAAVMLVSALLGILGTFVGHHLLGVYGMLMGLGLAGLGAFCLSATIAMRRGFADLYFDAAVLTILFGGYALVLNKLMGWNWFS